MSISFSSEEISLLLPSTDDFFLYFCKQSVLELELSPSAYEICGKLELVLPLEDLFLDLLFLLGLAPPLSELSGGVEDDEAAAFTAAFEQSKGW